MNSSGKYKMDKNEQLSNVLKNIFTYTDFFISLLKRLFSLNEFVTDINRDT